MDEKEIGSNTQYLTSEVEEHGTDVRAYLLAILNRRWLVLSVTALFVLGIAAYSFLQTPLYMSKSVLEIDIPGTYLFVSDPANQPTYWRNRDPFMKTQYRLLKGKNLGKSVAQKLDLKPEDLKMNSKRNSAKDSVTTKSTEAELDLVGSALLEMVSVEPLADTNLCEIIFMTPDPVLSKTLAEAWAEGYLEQYMGSMQQYTKKAEELLLEQVERLQKEVAEKEKLLYDYSIEKGIVKPDKNGSMALSSLTDANTSLISATRDRITAEVRYSALRSAPKSGIPGVMSHPSVIRARDQYDILERTYHEKSKTYKPDYPEMVRLRADLDQMLRGLQLQIDKAYEEVLAGARSELQQASIQENALQNQLQKARMQTVESGRRELNYDKLVMEIDNKKLLLTSLIQKQNETGLSAQVQDRKAVTTRIIEHAELPASVFSPNIKKNILFGLMAGFFAGIALALALEFFDRTIKSPEDIERYIHLPFLGIIPRYSLEEGNGHKERGRALVRRKTTEVAVDNYTRDLLTANDPGSPASEAIKTIRTSLLLAFPGAPPRSILVTSSRAGEGKTFTACNLAISLTQLDKRVVLIDADMRNPRIHRVWGMPNNTGLSIYLTSDIEVESILRDTSVNRLSLISSGPKTPRPAELLASARFQELLEKLEQQFDFVILDSPPVLPVTDSVILASKAKGVVIVVYGGSTPREVVSMAKKKLSPSNPVILGTIVNGIDFSDPYYYYRYYSSYSYEYYGDPGRPTDPA